MHREVQHKLESLTTNSNLERAKLYLKKHLNKIIRVNNTFVIATLNGKKNYRVIVEKLDQHEKTICTCPYDSKGLCKHSIAVLLAVLKNDDLIEDKSVVFWKAFLYKYAIKSYIKTISLYRSYF